MAIEENKMMTSANYLLQVTLEDLQKIFRTGGNKMKAKGLRQERETIIKFNDAEDIASVWTASQTVYRALKKIGYSPVADDERSARFEISKADIRLPRPKRKLTPAQRRARIKALNSRKSALRVGEISESIARRA
jgi:lipoate-protein ligase A